jgi:hypothetical protein
MRRALGVSLVLAAASVASVSLADEPAQSLSNADPLRTALLARSSEDSFAPADTTTYRAGEGVERWRADTLVRSGPESRTVDTVRLWRGGVDRDPASLFSRSEPFDAADADRYSLEVTRGWNRALSLKAGGLDLDVSPRAGLAVSDRGGGATAGATVRLGPDLEDEVVGRVTDVLGGLGVKTVDGASFGNRSRWYLFAAADGRAVGLNVMRDAEGDWSRRGWSSDPSAVMGEAQLGVGWRKGAMQASFGYVHREIKATGVHNAENTKIEDGAVAFSLSIKPGR